MLKLDKEGIRREIARYVGLHRSPFPGDEPLTGFASALDPLFQKLRKAVSPSHLLPEDLLPSAQSVVAFFIPFERAVARSNVSGGPASREWARAYVDTNRLIEGVNRHMAALFRLSGYGAAVTPATHNFDPARLLSDWSHRHVAYIAGLGRFGANHMLITEKGCCGRLGSFVTTLPLDGDERPRRESCLHLNGNPCLRCVGRCVGEALSPVGFDRAKCYAVCRENEERHRDLGKADVCGKCLVGLPCSWTDPVSAVSNRRGPDPA
ncbi:MAG TPA: epoxyqueuosine reductase [Deltaproteobacteria bacterium]|nr:epoxyqueuosine reductase [Deltaproteobacteria bacterium]